MDPRQDLLEQRITGLEQRIAYLERIVKVSQILNSTLSLDPLLRIIIQSATELTHTEACSIMLLDKQTGELRFAHMIGETAADLRNLTVSLDHSIAGWIVRHREPAFSNNVYFLGPPVVEWLWPSTNIVTGLDAGDFTTVTDANGSKQTAYYGWPLYYYSGDVTAGSGRSARLSFVVPGFRAIAFIVAPPCHFP